MVIATAYPCDVGLFRAALERLGAVAGLRHDCPEEGIFMTSTATPTGERFLHLLNLDGFPKTLRLFEHGRPLLDGRPLTLQARDGVMLPLGVRFQEFTVVQGTAEIRGVGPGVLELRLTQPEDWIELESATEPAPSADYRVERAGRGFRVVSRKDARVDDRLRVRWERS